MDLLATVGIGQTAAEVKGVQAAARQMAENLVRRSDSESLESGMCPADRRIEAYLSSCFADLAEAGELRLPASLVLPRYGIARELSLPAEGDVYRNDQVTSFRVRNGVLHNPRSDRRTTQGTFHVCEGGLPIPADKRAVPRRTFAALFQQAVRPPADLAAVPLTSDRPNPLRTFVSLLLRPIVCPAAPGGVVERSMEVRFFVPGALVSNLDFVESIFGNAGDPHSPENDAGLDAEHWTGHTGCVLLAPHLVKLTKKSLGLPTWDQATQRQQMAGHLAAASMGMAAEVGRKAAGGPPVGPQIGRAHV